MMEFHTALVVLLVHSACGFNQELVTVEVTCGDASGIIQTPGYDVYEYPNDLIWTTVVTGEAGMTFFLSFSYFDLENEYDGECQDYLQIRDSGVLIAESCGLRSPPNIITSTNKFSIRLITNSAVQKRGAKLSYFQGCVGCGISALECSEFYGGACTSTTCHSNTIVQTMSHMTRRIACGTNIFSCMIACDPCPEGNLGLCDEVVAAKEALGQSCTVYGKSSCSKTQGVGMMSQVLKCFVPGSSLPTFGKCMNPCCCNPRPAAAGSSPSIHCRTPSVLIETDYDILCGTLPENTFG